MQHQTHEQNISGEQAPFLRIFTSTLAPIVRDAVQQNAKLAVRIMFSRPAAIHSIACWLFFCAPGGPAEVAAQIATTHPRDLLRAAMPDAPATLYRALDRAGDRVRPRGFYVRLRKAARHVGLTDDRQTLGRYLFKRHGAKVVILGRFVAILRTFAAVLAGANQMPWPRFLISNAVDGIAWACLYGFGAYALGEQVKHIAGAVGIGLAVIAAIVIGAAILYVRKHEPRLIEQAKRGMHHDGR
jgi:hypothetical protein